MPVHGFDGDSLIRKLRTSAPILALGLAACVSTDSGSPATLSVPLTEGVLSGELGDSLDRRARRKAAEAEYIALETGKTGVPVSWKVSDELYGRVIPQQPYLVGKTDCRRYVHTVSDSGTVRSAAGTACRGEDGVWQPLS